MIDVLLHIVVQKSTFKVFELKTLTHIHLLLFDLRLRSLCPQKNEDGTLENCTKYDNSP